MEGGQGKGKIRGASLTLQWLRLCASNAGGMDLIPGWKNLRSNMPCVTAKKKERPRNLPSEPKHRNKLEINERHKWKGGLEPYYGRHTHQDEKYFNKQG